MTSRAQLGFFSLKRIVGRGAMGEVWLGLHQGQNVPVAVKVLTPDRARSAVFQRAIRREVRSMAALNHPSIVTLFDTGEIDEAAEYSSGGRLVAGSPYLVMELASGGTLEDLVLPLDWTRTRAVLLEILDALAHAHARGVIHRDLKPGNVLISTTNDVRPGLKLTDFGLAHALTDTDDVTAASHSAGTPAFMAPEQLLGKWRDFGPWTDLYALGCMTFELLTGMLPFEDENIMVLAQHHLRTPAPLISTPQPLPAGVPEWIQRLMAKAPHERFQTAADAAWALLELGGVEGQPAPLGRQATIAALPVHRFESQLTNDLDASNDTVIDDSPRFLPTLASMNSKQGHRMLRIAADSRLPTLNFMGSVEELEEVMAPAPVRPRVHTDVPPFPNTWRRPVPPQHPVQLEGVGLKLFGLRSVPLVDRNADRDALWGLLGQVIISGSSLMAVVRGNAGVGKTALAKWMAERAYEVGAAIVLHATHSPMQGSDGGVPRMILDFLHASGMSRDDLAAAIQRKQEELGIDDKHGYRRAAAVEALIPGSFDPSEMGRFSVRTAEERYIAYGALLGALARQRPLILLFDDVQWAPDTLRFLQHLMARQSQYPVPMLILTTVRTDALASLPVETQLLHELEALDEVETLDLAPLSQNDHRELVESLLRLEPSLVDRIIDRTSGNPLFATQIVGDWVQREDLVVGEAGFHLRKGVDPKLPDELHYLWRGRLDRLLNTIGYENAWRARQALQTCALLGAEISDAEWRTVATEMKLDRPEPLLNLLAENDLVSVGEHGFRFAHTMFRESLERLARESGTLTGLHERCLQIVETLYGGKSGHEERRAYHLQGAGRLSEAFNPLLQAARERMAVTQYDAAFRLIERAQGILEELQTPADDTNHFLAKLEWVQALVLAVKVVEALEVLDTAAESVSGAISQELEARAALVRGQIYLKIGISDKAIECFLTAREGYTSLDDSLGIAMSLVGAGEAYQKQRDTDIALELLNKAREGFTTLGHLAGLSQTLRMLGYCAMDLGDYDGMTHYALQARDAAAKAGDRYSVAISEFDLGMAALHRDDADAAEEVLHRSLAKFIEIGSGDAAFPRCYLAAIAMKANDLDTAEKWLVEALTELEASGRAVYAGGPHVGMMVVTAARGKWDDFNKHVEGARSGLGKGDVLYAVIAETAEKAAGIATASGQPACAQAALSLALDQWKNMGRPDEVARLQALIK